MNYKYLGVGLLVVGGLLLIGQKQSNNKLKMGLNSSYSLPLASTSTMSSSQPTLGIPVSSLTTIPVNRSTLVAVAIPIPQPTPIPDSINLVRADPGQAPFVVSQLHDDGLNGDLVAGDGIYTTRLLLSESSPKTIKFYVTAAYRGISHRLQSRIINVFVTENGKVLLPADSGTTGTDTVVGTDSDGDGLRDDIQRYIITTYSTSTKLQLALIQYAKAYQAMMLDGSNSSLAPLDNQSCSYATDCLYYIVPNTAAQVISQLEGKMANSRDRFRAALSADFSGTDDTPIPSKGQGKTRCLFDPNILPN